MEDFLKAYKKKNTVKNAGIVVASFFLALGVNMQFQGTHFSQYLKGNILESQQQEIYSDLYISKDGDVITIKNGAKINNLKQIQFSLIYNADSLKAININNNIDNYNLKYNYIDYGILNIQISGDGTRTLSELSDLMKINISQLNEDFREENINLLQANFTDISGKTYRLTTSGVSF